jgi:predicted small lipoprotein YifL
MKGHRVFVLVSLAACGGSKKPPTEPEHDVVTAPPPHKETEEDRAKKRHDAAVAIVPEGSKCLPDALKADNAPRLELAGEGADAVLCAVDTDPSRLLGTIACWSIDLKNIDAKTNSPGLVPQDAAPLPGHDVDVLLDGKCARGFCMPDDAKLPDDKVAHMSWSLDGKQVAVLVGDDVHLFDAGSKAHSSTFSTKVDKGPSAPAVAVYFAGDTIFVEGRDDNTDSVWGFKADGTATGPLTQLGGKGDQPISIAKGSFSIIDPGHVALADHGMETLTTYEVATGKRIKAVRKVGKVVCKPAEIDTYYKGGDKVTDKCRDSLDKGSAPLVGATAVMGKTNLLVVLRGPRLGELAVLDPKSLTESKKAFRLPWCSAAGDGAAAAEEAPSGTRGAVKKSGDPEDGGNKTTPKKSGDPEDGGN